MELLRSGNAPRNASILSSFLSACFNSRATPICNKKTNTSPQRCNDHNGLIRHIMCLIIGTIIGRARALSSFPLFRPWTLAVPSNDALSTCDPSREDKKEKTSSNENGSSAELSGRCVVLSGGTGVGGWVHGWVGGCAGARAGARTVAAEAHGGDPLGVGALKLAQALPRRHLPHLLGKESDNG